MKPRFTERSDRKSLAEFTPHSVTVRNATKYLSEGFNSRI